MKNDDVKITYYKTGREEHPIAVIRFSDSLEEMLETDRVFLRFDAQKLYFEKADPGHGLSLNFGKIQIWKLANKFEFWVGAYPLRFDVLRCSYFIELCDKVEIEQKNEGAKTGNPVQYTKHFGSTRKNSNDKIKEKVAKIIQEEQVAEIVEEKPLEPEKPIMSAPEKAVLLMLMDKIISQIDAGKCEDAKSVAVTVKVLLNE